MEVKIPEDPFIQELLPEFIETWISDLDNQFDNLIASQNDADLYRLAHTLKGSCAQFGLDDISKMGIELMGHTKNKDFETAATYGPPLKAAFRYVKQYLEENPISE